jgi:transcriptional antiterminator
MNDKLIYDHRFDNLEIEDLAAIDCVKERLLDVIAAGILEEEYVTFDQLQEEFSCSKYQISKYLEQIGAKPFGELKNVLESGKRMRGVGKLVFKKSVVDEVLELTKQDIDMEAIMASAKETIES